MNDGNHELFETELLRLRPAMPPEEFMVRLAQARPLLRAERNLGHRLVQVSVWRLLIRWLAPIAAATMVAVALLVWWLTSSPNKPPQRFAAVPASPALKADDVEIDWQLVAAFDAVARMPDGEPVRFRCFEWADEVVLRDSARDVVVEQRRPRLEVVPVSFETY
jgi:hypothetical protein